MLCERCKKNDSTIHLTEIIKDVRSEVHICEQCAKEIGLNSKLSIFSLSVSEMLSFLDISEVSECDNNIVCKVCGMSIIDYRHQGKLGCPDCYNYLQESLSSIIASYHGEKRHIGKIPRNIDNGQQQDEEAGYPNVNHSPPADLEKQLKLAVSEERYEDAALIRDELKDKVN